MYRVWSLTCTDFNYIMSAIVQQIGSWKHVNPCFYDMILRKIKRNIHVFKSAVAR